MVSVITITTNLLCIKASGKEINQLNIDSKNETKYKELKS